MKLKGDVLNASIEERELVGKDGTKRNAKISHVLLIVTNVDKDADGKPVKSPEVVNLRAYDADWPLPAIGTKDWETPRVRKYENYDGNVAEVSC